ncbi:anti-sigma factor family protein [Microvirga lotononidis]|uniref:Transmembrane transcriptional regulator (Anti-sigma factor) n=1 Tax=Microvirga lotononidis TaxID=864069 RepID=I4YLG6_9HYPH|nr:hypothetical protein [Microvirga lotononidis]EIM24808.1 hypothetical protein MicloDRAFT_00055270 [Microvirga lotononidis]WQO29688.1 hypothetical protein U0023_11680 [Microvirga lotononidis]
MSQLHLSDEILMAFADGELDGPTTTAIAKTMAEDPAVAKRITDFQQSRRLTRSVFSAGSMLDVPPQLRASVSAQIETYEAARRASSDSHVESARRGWFHRKSSFVQMALAASIAAVALSLGYFAGSREGAGAGGLMAQLETPAVHRTLSTIASGQDVELPFGRLRVISTYRLADGSLCREFRLQAAKEATNAVACRRNDWNTTFAVAIAVTEAEYAPSDGDDLMTTYLRNISAGEALMGDAEARALAEPGR